MKTFPVAFSNPGHNAEFNFETGTTTYFIGANGSGKTRLATAINDRLGNNGHRVAAQRVLVLNPSVEKITEQQALSGLRDNLGTNPVALVNDFKFIIQALYADQVKITLETHQKVRAKEIFEPAPTKFEILKNIWEELLPHRELLIESDNIMVQGREGIPRYLATQLSDGERGIFYLLGNVLCASENTVLIFDEPELHIHRSTMARLWDKLESLRTDCAFVVISHDIEFVASRRGRKYVIKEFTPLSKWEFEEINDDRGFDEGLMELLVGSRKPVLFVEGKKKGLDNILYRSIYPQWTVIPLGSCEDVIHAVATFNANPQLTRIRCYGIVDADSRSRDQTARLLSMNIVTLPVSEIENIFLLPSVVDAIARQDGSTEERCKEIKEQLTDSVIGLINKDGNLERSVVGYCKRQVDEALKRIGLSAVSSVGEIETALVTEIAKLNITDLAATRRKEINDAIAGRDIEQLLKIFDNKGLFSIAASVVKKYNAASFESWILHTMSNNTLPNVRDAIIAVLPTIS